MRFVASTPHLNRLGVNDNHLRWLLKKDFLSHAIETSLITNSQRRFHENCGPTFNDHSCFFLTGNGFKLFGESDGKLSEGPSSESLAERLCQSTDRLDGMESHREIAPVPVWNADRQELRYVGELVKRYKLPSKNQIAVLISFQEDGWPVRIDDPLKPPRVVGGLNGQLEIRFGENRMIHAVTSLEIGNNRASKPKTNFRR